jgi:hypothetical protein
MSRASDAFAQSIRDAENLLAHFDKLNTKPPPPENEVLKRAGLIMAMTAWETYVEDRILEAAGERLQRLDDAAIARFVRSRLDDDVKRLHNPSSEKTIQLFRDFAGIDLTDKWKCNPLDAVAVRARLNRYIKLRGDIVHRSPSIASGPPKPHPISREELAKAIRFLKALVASTENELRLT